MALQSPVKRLWHNGNRKEPPLLFTAHWRPQDPLPRGWNANPNTKTAWQGARSHCREARTSGWPRLESEVASVAGAEQQ